MSIPTTIVGNLTGDPELRFTPSGTAVVSFSVAVNEKRLDRQTGEWVDEHPQFMRVTAWRSLAEHIAESLTRGSRVIVTGDLKQEVWTDKKTDTERREWKLNARSVGADLTFSTVTIKKATRNDGAPIEDHPDWK